MSTQSSNFTGLPVAASTLAPFPAVATPAPLIELASEKAETIIRDALAAVFRGARGTVKEIRLLDHVDLRLAKVEEGVDVEINDTTTIVQL